MFRGVWQLAWLETKIFVREPLGLFGAVAVPVLLFVALERLGRTSGSPRRGASAAVPVLSLELPIIVAMLIALSAVLSLVAIMAIYRESGILKRLRATPLRPTTILTAHVMVKILFTAVSLALMAAAGRRFGVAQPPETIVSFGVALAFCTVCIMSLGFLIASVVPTARFAQPLGSLVLYPMLALSGLFVPVDAMPAPLQSLARLTPLTYAVSLLRGVWQGDGWGAHLGDALVLVVMSAVFAMLSSRLFRWE
ncbi:MAG: ABC transporter permease [Vicinamibacterales bacterium]